MIWSIACSETMTSAPDISVGVSAAAEKIFICEGLNVAADPVQQEAARTAAAGRQESAAGAQVSAAWVQESAARAQESGARAVESAIRAFESNLQVQTQYYKKLLQK